MAMPAMAEVTHWVLVLPFFLSFLFLSFIGGQRHAAYSWIAWKANDSYIDYT
jgi:hypothetical protein